MLFFSFFSRYCLVKIPLHLSRPVCTSLLYHKKDSASYNLLAPPLFFFSFLFIIVNGPITEKRKKTQAPERMKFTSSNIHNAHPFWYVLAWKSSSLIMVLELIWYTIASLPAFYLVVVNLSSYLHNRVSQRFFAFWGVHRTIQLCQPSIVPVLLPLHACGGIE